MPDIAGIPRDRDARPSLDKVLALQADRMGTVRRVVADLTDDQLDGSTEPVAEPGWPPPESFPSGRSGHDHQRRVVAQAVRRAGSRGRWRSAVVTGSMESRPA
jgi:hypothetical protein